MGHIAKSCPQLQSIEIIANCVSTTSRKYKTWLLNFATTHNITGDLANLSIHFQYDGTYEVIIGDGSSLAVSHICSLKLHSPKHTFILRDIFCVPNLTRASSLFIISQNKIMSLLNFINLNFLWRTRSQGDFTLRSMWKWYIYFFKANRVHSIKNSCKHAWMDVHWWVAQAYWTAFQ